MRLCDDSSKLHHRQPSPQSHELELQLRFIASFTYFIRAAEEAVALVQLPQSTHHQIQQLLLCDVQILTLF